MYLRLGDVLVKQGVLTSEQRDAIISQQLTTQRPFGWLAEQMFNVDPVDVENAWAYQYESVTKTMDPLKQKIDPAALQLISRRQAWQFSVVPIKFNRDEVIVCTTRDNLARALRFVNWSINQACSIAVSDEERLNDALAKCYPVAGLGYRNLVG